MHFQNNRNKHMVCLMAAIVAGLIGWRVLADTPFPTLNALAGLCIAVGVYLIVWSVIDGPLGPLFVSKNCERIGLVNASGEAPILIHNRPYEKVKNGMILTFCNRGIEKEKWDKKIESIEAAFNIFILKITEGKNRRTVEVYAVPATAGLPDMIPWRAEYLSPISTVLVLGRSRIDWVSVDLMRIPHILLAGSTGSGKSVLLKLLLHQCVQKDMSVYIADFKGGLDFPHHWRESCHMTFDMGVFLDTLKELVGEMETRKQVCSRAGCANIEIYNAAVRHIYKHIVVACDEVAELLYKTGRSREEKEIIEEITGCLGTIARQGRAVGVHLILATQRPDAKVLEGQIKNNIDFRVCGRADNVLSQIILDSTDAADKIPKDAQGRFLTNGGTLFQAFWYDDSEGGI